VAFSNLVIKSYACSGINLWANLLFLSATEAKSKNNFEFIYISVNGVVLVNNS
jgi:hypothetical protein